MDYPTPNSKGDLMKSLSRRILFGLPLPYFLSAKQSQAASLPTERPTTTPGSWIRTELYFGTAKPGGVVTEAQFAAFVDEVVTPRFPDGLTLLTGYGQFRMSTGEIKQEMSHVLILFYPPGGRNSNKFIEEIRQIYKMRFEQESVLRADSTEQISF
jgi:hypothetical protein